MSWLSFVSRLLLLLKVLLDSIREATIRRDERARNELETRRKIDEKVALARDVADRNKSVGSDIDDDDGFRRN